MNVHEISKISRAGGTPGVPRLYLRSDDYAGQFPACRSPDPAAGIMAGYALPALL